MENCGIQKPVTGPLDGHGLNSKRGVEQSVAGVYVDEHFLFGWPWTPAVGSNFI